MIHEHSWCYAFFKQYVKFIHRRFYCNVFASGLENIPVGKPIIFGPNHQNALMDPLAMLLTTPLQPVFLARADIFRSRFVSPVLRFLKILPVYRVRDGFQSLGNNEGTFNESIGVLEDNKQLALFPEARHHDQFFLLPLKKGIPRIALQAEEKHGFSLDLQVVPVGIHYSNYYSYQATVWVQYGKPIPVDDLKDEYTKNPQKTHLILRDRIADGIKPLMLNIEDTDHYEEFMTILNLNDEVQKKHHQKSFLNDLKSCASKLQNNTGSIKQSLLNDARQFNKMLKQKGLNASDFSGSAKVKASTLIELIVLFPVFIVGILSSLIYLVPPWFLYRNLKDRQFESTFKYMFQMLLSPLSYALIAFWLIPAIVVMPIWLKALCFVALFYAGSYALNYYNKICKLAHRLRTSTKRKSLEKNANTLKEKIGEFFG